MRRAILLSLLPVLAAAPLAAQAFEGTITMNMPMFGKGAEGTYMIKGDKVVTTVPLKEGMGMKAGSEMRMYIDRSTMTSTALIPMEMGGGKGVKMVTDLTKPIPGVKTTPTYRDLGTSETVAGIKCDNVEVTDGKDVTVVCITGAMGMFALPTTGGRGMGKANGWAAVFIHHPGFPLKVTDGKGQVMMEVTSVKPGKVPDSEFVIPDGYMDMPSFGGMRGGGGGR